MSRLGWKVLLRHQLLVRDGSLFIAIIGASAAVAFLFDLSGRWSRRPQIELDELLILGIIFGAGVAWFGWRRILEQEQEISAKTLAERHAEFLAHHDHLTGLPNRRRLQQELQWTVTAPPAADRTHALLLLDLNGFKKINDIFGHARGDELLSIVSDRMSHVLPRESLLARTGGDEFAIVLKHQLMTEGGERVAEQIIECLRLPIRVGADEHRVGIGIGIALIPADGMQPGELMRKADVALYKAKALGGSRFISFKEDMDRVTRKRDMMQRELAAAVADRTIVPFYQPIMDLKTGKVRAFEALARWSHPTLGLVPATVFVPLAEESGLISELSDQLLRTACSDAMAWPTHVGLSFNVSPAMLRDLTLGMRILRIIEASGLSPKRLELEITESAITQDFDAARESLEVLRKGGLRIVLDDFGTGATSLAHLRSFRFDGLKIDRRFINLMLEEEESAAIVRAVLGLAKGLDLTVVAEGIEQAAQCERLQVEGCTAAQGYYFSHAVAAAETARFFSDPQIYSLPASGRQ